VPRPQPTREDATALRLLDAAAQLIDAYLQAEPLRQDQSARLRQIKFPAALEWLGVSDVTRLAGAGGRGVTRKSLYNRWPTRDDFLADAVVHALVREEGAHNAHEFADRVPALLQATGSVSASIIQVSDGLLDSLLRQPRSYLPLHIGPLLPQHPRLAGAVEPPLRHVIRVWAEMYEGLANGLGLVMRPEWSFERISFALQAMIDGFVLRFRVHPTEFPASRWEGASIFADSAIAFALGVVDWTRTGKTCRVTLDEHVEG
jgi:AcrR family transcriptional regulator